MAHFKRHNKSTSSLEFKVKCPWCYYRNDHTRLADLGGHEVGTRVKCDECGNEYVVVAVYKQPTIQVKQWPPFIGGE